MPKESLPIENRYPKHIVDAFNAVKNGDLAVLDRLELGDVVGVRQMLEENADLKDTLQMTKDYINKRSPKE